jgi:nucleotide-binding universal stress UspA family protein
MMIETILVPLDGSSLAETALPHARRFALATRAAVVLVRVVRGGRLDDMAPSEAVAEAERYLRSVAGDLARGGLAAQWEVILGEPVEGILFAAHNHGAGVIVMSTHGLTGLHHALLGSVAEAVLRAAHLPVLLLQAGREAGPLPMGLYRKILVPLDGSPGAEAALRYVACEEFARHAEILLLHSEVPVPLHRMAPGYGSLFGATAYIPQAAVDEVEKETEEHRRSAEVYLANVARMYLSGHPCRVDVPVDDPVRAAVGEAAREGVDLIVMTTHARTGLDRLREGSVAADVLRDARLPVLLLRPDDGAGVRPLPDGVEEKVPA